MSASRKRATLADLYSVEGKAELICGKVVPLPLLGARPGLIVGNIASSLNDYSCKTGRGEAFTPTIVYAIRELPSGRESISPDVSFYDGPFPENEMGFIQGPPTFAVELTAKSRTYQLSEIELAAKRDDYFEAGTLVVWDVDPTAETVACYRNATDPPIIWKRDDVADAEPAVPGWSMPVNDIFA